MSEIQKQEKPQIDTVQLAKLLASATQVAANAPSGFGSEKGSQMILATWATVLNFGGVNPDHLPEAFTAHASKSKFFPTPAEIIAICKSIAAREHAVRIGRDRALKAPAEPLSREERDACVRISEILDAVVENRRIRDESPKLRIVRGAGEMTDEEAVRLRDESIRKMREGSA